MPEFPVSIIMRTRNRPGLLRRALASVSAQTFSGYELVLVDSGGLDETKAVADAFPGSIKHVSSPPARVGALLNTGIGEASGEFVAVLDDDDTWEPEYLEAMLAPLSDPAGEKVAGTVCWTTCLKEEADTSGGWATTETFALGDPFRDLTIYDLAAANQFTTNAFVYSRAAALEVGGYDGALEVGEDWDFNLRFIQKFDLYVVERALAYYHMRTGIGVGDLANTIGHARDAHRFYPSSVINHHLRQALAGEGSGLGMLMATARGEKKLHAQIRQLEEKLAGVSTKIGRIDSRTKQLKDGLAKKG